MFCDEKHEIIADADLLALSKFVIAPHILLDCENIAYMNASCSSLFGYDSFDMQKPIKTNNVFVDESFIDEINNIYDSNTDTGLVDTFIFTNNRKLIFVNLECKVVIYKSKKYIFAHLHDMTEKLATQSKLIKAAVLKELMLDISQSIIKIEDIHQVYDLILENAIKALEKARIGTIFIKEDGVYKVVSYVGFSKEIIDYQLKAEDTFLYKATDGKMNSIVNIPDVMPLAEVNAANYPVRTTLGDQYIKSSIVVPIHINGEVYGMISIDSLVNNAFCDDDVKSMEYIKNSIEIAIANFLHYEEKIYLANHDSLTKLFNRVYIEEKFDKYKEEALKKNSNLHMVLFDIDNLKRINDCYGHCEGDSVIIKISDELKKLAGENDVLARIGGDEFLGLFFDEDIDSLFSKIKNSLIKISNNSDTDNQGISYSFSFGMSSFGEDGQEFKELFKKADERMYSIKSHKENVDSIL